MWGLIAADPLVVWVRDAGSIGILAFILVLFLRGNIVTGGEHQRVIDERDRALELVFKQAGLAGRAVDLSMARLEIEAEILELRQRGGGGGPSKSS